MVHASCQLEQLAVSFCVVSLTWQLHGRQAFYWRFRIPKIYDPRERMSDIEIEGERERERNRLSILVLSFISYVTLSRPFILSEPRFSNFKNQGLFWVAQKKTSGQ